MVSVDELLSPAVGPTDEPIDDFSMTGLKVRKRRTNQNNSIRQSLVAMTDV
jgi:hypothetical protein